MSSSALFDTKERVRQAIDIVELVGSYLQLRREGRITRPSALGTTIRVPACRSIQSGNRSNVGFATSAETSSASR